VLRVIVLALLTTKLAVLVANLRWFPTLKLLRSTGIEGGIEGGTVGDASSTGDGGLTLLVPIRNEAQRIPFRLPGLLASGATEIIFLDDESTDDTSAVIGSLMAHRSPAESPTVRVVRGTSRPDGWVGKTWACAQLAELTQAHLLLFCDADVDLSPGAVPLVLAEMHCQEADVLSVICRQRTVTWAERLLTPLITDVVLCLFPFGLLRAPVPSAATAQGAVLVFSRAAYQELGGFAAVRGELVEDVAIARLTRRRGLQLGLVLGGEVVQCRMYEGYRDIILGLGRGLVPVLGGRRWLLIAGWLLHLAAYTAPLILLPFSRVWRFAALLGVVERLLVEAKTGGRDWPAAALTAASPIAALPVVLRALRRKQIWKGREYL
jgi:hypothetical protein